MNGENINNQPPQSFYPPQKKNILASLFLLVIVLFFSFAVVLATRIWDPLWNPFRLKPEKVIERMHEKMKKIKTMNSSMNIGAKIDNEPKIDFNFLVEGKTDQNDPQNIKTEHNFDILISVGSKQGNISFNTRINGEAKTIGETSYFKIKQLPFGFEFLVSPNNASQLTNNWIKVDSSSTLEMMKEIIEKESAGTGRKRDYTEVEREYLENLEKNKKLQAEFKKKLEEMLSKKDLYQVKKEFPDEKINGILTYHYLIVINKEKLGEIIMETLRVIEGMSNTPILFPDSKEEIKELITKIGDLEEELWIGKKDYFFTKPNSKKKLT